MLLLTAIDFTCVDIVLAVTCHPDFDPTQILPWDPFLPINDLWM